MLIKKCEKDISLTKKDLAKHISADSNIITVWKKLYDQTGITALMADGRIGFKPSLVSTEEYKKIK